MGKIILFFMTTILTGVIICEIYFLVYMIKNKRLEKKYENDVELQKRLRKENEIFWKNRNFRSI